MNTQRYDRRETRRDLPDAVRVDYLRENGWSTMEVLRMEQHEQQQAEELARMHHLIAMATEYRRVREQRHVASTRQDLQAVAMWNEELTSWYEQIVAYQHTYDIPGHTIHKLLAE